MMSLLSDGRCLEGIAAEELTDQVVGLISCTFHRRLSFRIVYTDRE